MREEGRKGEEEDRAPGVLVQLDCCEDIHSNERIPTRRVFIPLPVPQQEGCYISRLQSPANGEKERMLIPASTTGLRMDKLSLHKTCNYSTVEIRMTVIVVYVTKVQRLWPWQIYICTP